MHYFPKVAVITVLGAGMMGSALCVPLIDRGHEVRLVGTHLDASIVERLLKDRVHPNMGIAFPAELRVYPFERFDEALSGAELVGLGVSSEGVRWAARTLAPHFGTTLPTDVPILSIAKGLESGADGLAILPDAFREELPAPLQERIHPVGVAGPCIAGELARRVDTCVVFAGRDRAPVARCAALARGDYYHVFESTDVVGVETCAALKNAYAMGIAFAAGQHAASGGKPGSIARHNYESAVFAQSVVEMQQIVALLGGDPRSAAGLAGAGDLDVTTNGGRTGRFGAHLGSGIGVAGAIQAMQGATLECLHILRTMRDAVSRLEAAGTISPHDLPLLRHMAEVALDDRPVAMPFDRFFGAHP